MLASHIMAGFECSTHRRSDGRRLDLIAATDHDRLAAQDYAMLRNIGIAGVRDGLRWHLIGAERGGYDWASARPMIDAARAAGTQVIWDLLHYGWPDWIDPWAADFVPRFVDFALAAAQQIGPGGCYTPVNEISFLSWAGGEVGYINPFASGRGDELKHILCRAAIEASRALHQADPAARMFTAEPLIRVHPARPGLAHEEEAALLDAAQHDATAVLLGRRWPELGGSEELIDVIGLNYYPHNQFTDLRDTVWRGDRRYAPLSELLVEAQARYRRPLFLAETGVEDEERPEWLRYVCQQVRLANRRGAGVEAVCLYPILDHPGWDDDRQCRNGLFCGMSGTERALYQPLLEEVVRQGALGLS